MDFTALLLMLLMEQLKNRRITEDEQSGRLEQLPALPPSHGIVGQTPTPGGFLHGELMGPTRL